MKWFKHDSNAYSDAKLQKLKIKYGMQGFGLYWFILELIAANIDKHNITFELEHDAEIIAANTGLDANLVQQMLSYMVELDLFDFINEKIICTKMASRTDEYTQKIIRQQQKSNTKNNNTPDSVGTKSDLIEEKRIEKNRIEKNRREKIYRVRRLTRWICKIKRLIKILVPTLYKLLWIILQPSIIPI